MPSLEIFINMVAKPFVFPVIIGLTIWAILAAPTFRHIRRPPGIHGSAAAIAISVAFLIGITISRNIRSFWPGSWIDWLPTLLGIAIVIIGWSALLLPWLPRRWRTLAIGDLAAIGTLIGVWPIALLYGNAQGWPTLTIAAFIALAALLAAAIALIIALIDPTLPSSSSPLTPSPSGGGPGRGSTPTTSSSSPPSSTLPPPIPIHATLIPLGLIGAILGMAAAGVMAWGAPSTATNIATLGLLIGIFALLALPPLRFTAAVRLRWLAPIIATAGVSLAAAALVSSADPIPWPSPVLLALAALTPLLLILRPFNPALGWPSALLALITTLALAGVLTLGSIAFAEGWIELPTTTQDTADDDAEADEWRQMFDSWSPDTN